MRGLRVASVFVPSLIAVVVAINTSVSQVHGAGLVLAGMWILMACALWMRYRQARAVDVSLDNRLSWQQLDVLSATGRATVWTAVLALALASKTGWASLSVLAILGLGVICVATTWIAIAAGGDVPWRTAVIKREVLPAIAVEDEPLRETLHLEGVTIPTGMRLFASGRPLRHGAVTRYAVGSDGSGANLELESHLGPARRGEHHAPPMTLWLGDVLGLTRTAPIDRGGVSFVVMPRPAKIDDVRELLGDGGDAMTSREAIRMPTEGSFRIREYAPGDDTRRIHWVRSLQANQLVVRLPDEIPPADPVVRVVLDNHFAEIRRFTSSAPDELLDAMIRVWLGVGKALADSGARVTLVTGVAKGEAFRRAERPWLSRTHNDTARFAARVGWQPTVRLDMLLDRTNARQIVVSSRPRAADKADERAGCNDRSVTWVVVPHNEWTSAETHFRESLVMLPFAAGSAENRLSRRKAERKRLLERWEGRRLFSRLCAVDWTSLSGAYVARPGESGRVNLQVIPPRVLK